MSAGKTSFFKSLGSPKFISAPMVDQSSLPWRIFVRNNGADLAYGPMMNSNVFFSSSKVRSFFFDSSSNGSLVIHPKDSPSIAQFAGNDANCLVECGKYIHNMVDSIDLNLGCPQGIAKRGRYGAFLLTEPDLIVNVLSTMVRELSCPITAKIRILKSEQDTLELCQRIEATGISMLTVHGRTVDSSKQYVGEANWDIISKIKQKLSIPVVLNGGIGCRADALRALDLGVDAVMSSEALLENPKLFSEEGDALFKSDYIRCQLQTSDELVDLFRQHPVYEGPSQLRAHLFKILYRMLSGEANHDLRSRLAASYGISDIEEILAALKFNFRAIGFDEDKAMERGLIISTSWYNRHRGVILTPKNSMKIEKAAPEDIAVKLERLRSRLVKQ